MLTGFYVLTAVLMKSSFFWDITPCSPDYYYPGTLPSWQADSEENSCVYYGTRRFITMLTMVRHFTLPPAGWRRGNALDLNSGGALFESWPGRRLS
jgi:hypothetical protein